MSSFVRISEVKPGDRDRIGGKGFALAVMARRGIAVPSALCIDLGVYRQFLSATGIDSRILFELGRKRFEDMRWEEIWDAALRIRNLFLTTPLPDGIRDSLRRVIESEFAGRAVVVRSSAPGEDSSRVSFAGLHDSFMNVRGSDRIIEHIRLVWASLWSDRALLYRREIGLDVAGSAMAVVVQEIIEGERSGVAFTQNPLEDSQAVVEAVYGLNQGLVDGTVEPDRWILDRQSGRIITHRGPPREKAVLPAPEGTVLGEIPAGRRGLPPLDNSEVGRVYELARHCEEIFGVPQDVEWTLRGDQLFALQSRPITTARSRGGDDARPWYLSLRRSFENLKRLRGKIEGEILPAMEREADVLSGTDVAQLSDRELADEMERRASTRDRWTKAYWDHCIPFAHGMRLFGEFYNDTIRPENPYEFMDYLSGSGMISLRRNALLEEMASLVRNDRDLETTLRTGVTPPSGDAFTDRFDRFLREFGDITMSFAGSPAGEERKKLLRLILEMARRPAGRVRRRDERELAGEFLSRFEGAGRSFAAEMLDLGRASYRLRDDDNIYLHRIEAQFGKARAEVLRRLEMRGVKNAGALAVPEILKALKDPAYVPSGVTAPPLKAPAGPFEIRARQIVGQPAGPGVVTGLARVVRAYEDLFEFSAGEILVCDALEPEMTFVIPLAAGIIERRGGMLIHGAIIAREYGIPCVTGVPEAVARIQTGDRVTVDGYLGIVVVDRSD